jgi:type VI secretion system protein ImpA
VPIAGDDPCGPDLDLQNDVHYLNFFASTEGILPSTFFFIQEGGKPYFLSQDEQAVNSRAALPSQIEAIKPLLARTSDIRLLVTRAQLLILNRDLAGFAASVASIAEWLDRFWDSVHPRDPAARVAALARLDLPTVVFPLQYAPLFEAARIGVVSYRSRMLALGEAKLRPGEQKADANSLSDALANSNPAVLSATRRHIAMLRASLARIRNGFLSHNADWGLKTLPALVEQISNFVDPHAAAPDQDLAAGAEPVSSEGQGPAPATLFQASEALAAIADYYSRREPSSPTLPLVRQAHQLIGKSFIEVMSILVPTQLEKAAFQIGTDQVFELPIGRLSKLPEAVVPATTEGPADPNTGSFRVQSRAQAIALLEQVQRFFRAAEPSSPVPMLCERARALAERDFMGVLRDVLPKAALKNVGIEK